MTPRTQVQSKTFFEHLQNTPGLDLRDKRGKRHPMAVVLLEFTLALLCNRDGCLSSIHRHIVNHHGRVMEEVKLSLEKAVSRSQLPVVLCKVSLPAFEDLVFGFYGIELKDEEKQWFAADGKELRGSIAKGDTRGEVVVLAVRHSDRVVVGQEHHNGMKESEIPSVRILLDESGLLGQKVSMDALHLNPDTLQAVQEAGGTYLVGLKGNQAEMLVEMECCAKLLRAQHKHSTCDKGHGRLDIRHYQCYDVRGAYIDKRWDECGITTLVKAERMRLEIKTGKQSAETALYLCNEDPQNLAQAKGLFNAVRNHWSVEAANHVRDKSLREDQLKTKKRSF